MILFLLIFFLLYGGVHLYAFVKIKSAFNINFLVKSLSILFMAMMVIAPLIIRVLEKKGLEAAAHFIAYSGYLWMGFIFFFFSISLCIDIYKLIIFLINKITENRATFLFPSAKISFCIALLLSIVISIYSYFEALNIKPKYITIQSSKLSESIGKIRIAQISDVHMGLIVREKRIKKMLDIVKRNNPDILVSTGDLVDGQDGTINSLYELFREINPKYGKYAITGNHEYYVGMDFSINFTKQAGFEVLRDETINIDDKIYITGIDDNTAMKNGSIEKKLISEIPKEKFALLLKHKPIINKESVGLFDLQLSGHTHKGQIFPFTLLTALYYNNKYAFLSGLHELGDSSYLYVNIGTGTWGPPMRFLSPPEVTIIDIVY